MAHSQSTPDAASEMPLAPTLQPLGEDPREAVQRCAEMRFRFVQLSATQPGLRPRELDQSARRGLVALLRRAGLSVSGLDLWIPTGHFADPGQVDRAVNAAALAIELAADIGRVPLSLALPAPTPAAAGAAPAVASDVVAPAISAIASCAERHGVALADHALPPSGWPNVGVGIDPAACLAQSIDPAELVAQSAERLASARLCDLLKNGLRGPIGEPQQGRLDVLAYQVALSVARYRGPVVVDARQWADALGGLEQTARAWSSAA